MLMSCFRMSGFTFLLSGGWSEWGGGYLGTGLSKFWNDAKSASSTSGQSRFAKVVLDRVMGLLRLAGHNRRCLWFSVIQEAKHEVRLRGKGPWRAPCQLTKPSNGPRQRRCIVAGNGREKCSQGRVIGNIDDFFSICSPNFWLLVPYLQWINEYYLQPCSTILVFGLMLVSKTISGVQ